MVRPSRRPGDYEGLKVAKTLARRSSLRVNRRMRTSEASDQSGNLLTQRTSSHNNFFSLQASLPPLAELRKKAETPDPWIVLTGHNFLNTAPSRPRSIKEWNWQIHHLNNRVNTVSATVVRLALPLSRKEIWRICKGLTIEELHDLEEATGTKISVSKVQARTIVAELALRQNEIIERTGIDPAISLSSEKLEAATSPVVDNKTTDMDREYEDPFHISKLLLKRASRERIERAQRGILHSTNRLRSEFEPSLVNWRRELWAVAQTIIERDDARRNGTLAQEGYLSRYDEVFERIRFAHVDTGHIAWLVEAAKIVKKSYLNAPTHGRAERAALREVEKRQPIASKRAQAVIAIGKSVNALLLWKIPDWRAEISEVRKRLTGVPLSTGLLHIRFGIEQNGQLLRTSKTSPSKLPNHADPRERAMSLLRSKTPSSHKKFKKRLWAQQHHVDRLLKHEIPAWRHEIGLSSMRPFAPTRKDNSATQVTTTPNGSGGPNELETQRQRGHLSPPYFEHHGTASRSPPPLTSIFTETQRRMAPFRQTIDLDELATSAPDKQPELETQQRSHGHLTHLTPSGSAHMVNITPKTSTHRLAVAVGTVSFSNPETLGLVRSAALKKGDVLSVARIAGIQAAKLCPMIIPLCHPIAISGVEVDVTVLDEVSVFLEDGKRIQQHCSRQEDKGSFRPPSSSQNSSRSLARGESPLEYGGIHVAARVECVGPTGVEMEALSAVMGACLTVVDMVKAVDRGAMIGDVKVVRKMGGRSGEWVDESCIGK